MLKVSAMEKYFLEIPILQQAVHFLEVAGGNDGIKLTEKGALGRNFVQNFWDTHIKTPEFVRFRPTRELECSEVTRVHFLLTETKYVRKYKGRVCLTEKGKSELLSNTSGGLYYDLLTVGMFGWNWGYEDRYPEFEFIQQSAEALLSALLMHPSKEVTAEQIFDMVFVSKILSSDGEKREHLLRCLNLRFFHRFCVPFGILKDDQDRFLDKNFKDTFEKTEFFMSEFSKVVNGVVDQRDELH